MISRRPARAQRLLERLADGLDELGRVVTKKVRASGSCSACAIRSRATSRASSVSSATMVSSEGPARPSIPTVPATWRLASVT